MDIREEVALWGHALQVGFSLTVYSFVHGLSVLLFLPDTF
jgi:hypothetical protein